MSEHDATLLLLAATVIVMIVMVWWLGRPVTEAQPSDYSPGHKFTITTNGGREVFTTDDPVEAAKAVRWFKGELTINE